MLNYQISPEFRDLYRPSRKDPTQIVAIRIRRALSCYLRHQPPRKMDKCGYVDVPILLKLLNNNFSQQLGRMLTERDLDYIISADSEYGFGCSMLVYNVDKTAIRASMGWSTKVLTGRTLDDLGVKKIDQSNHPRWLYYSVVVENWPPIVKNGGLYPSEIGQEFLTPGSINWIPDLDENDENRVCFRIDVSRITDPEFWAVEGFPDYYQMKFIPLEAITVYIIHQSILSKFYEAWGDRQPPCVKSLY